jgi:redox-sensitive bicupin YhaK (pirin superfamily)
MTAGRGIFHSERTPLDKRSFEAILHGIKTWVALPDEYEETGPWFRHHPATELPIGSRRDSTKLARSFADLHTAITQICLVSMIMLCFTCFGVML